MRKIFITLLSGIFLCLNSIDAQFTISMSSSTVDPGANATVDVTVSGFTNIAGTEYSINYDSTVLEFVSFTNVTTTLPGLMDGLSGPIGTTLKKGQIVVSWFSGTGTTIPNGTRIFSIVFKAIGANGAKSDVLTSNTPRKIEISNGSLQPVSLTNNKGTVTINGTPPPPTTCTDPTCANASNLALIGGTVSGKKGTNVCVPITVKNFNNMLSAQGTIGWNPLLLKFTSLTVPATGGIPDFKTSDINQTNAANGVLTYVWFKNDTQPTTVPDNTVMLNLCFDILGDPVQTACVETNRNTPTEVIWESSTGTAPMCFTFGKVNIVDDVKLPVNIKTSSASGNKGEIICLAISVENFTDIYGVGTQFSWDPTQLKFIRTENYSLEGLNSSVFNANGTSGTLKLNWSNGSAITKANGHVIFNICFELLCPGTSNHTATITVPGPTEIVGSVSGGPGSVPGTVTGNTISITCPQDSGNVTCTTGAITHVSCNGGSNGSAAMTVTGAGSDCVFQWKLNGTIVSTGLVSTGNLNLANAKAGSYTFDVLCSGVLKTTCTATINEPTIITIPTSGVVTNVGCGSKGSINISATSGGNGGYNYTWNPSLGNTANPTNLNAGTYAVTVTDSKGCNATASFVVGNTQTQLSQVTIAGTNVKCKNGNDGSASVSVSGGCTPYTYTWSGSLSGSNPQNLKAGTYTVTVSDSASPAQTGTASVTITEPSAIDISLTGTTSASSSTAEDGKINISISGGTPGNPANYKTVWSGGLPDANTSGTLEVSKVKAGSYNVTVTDANGCSTVRTEIVVSVKTVGEVAVELGTVAVTSGQNGFGVDCFNDKTGIIEGKITKGTYPINVTLKVGSQVINTLTLTNNLVDYKFTDLVAGTYTVTASNGVGTTATTIEIKQPTKLVATPTITCSNKDQETGAIELNMNNTGAGNYAYNWSNQTDLDNKLENLAVGFYNVTVTDDNGCRTLLTNLEVKQCSINGPCYEASSVITPNGDQKNDLFVINCVTDNSGDLSVYDRWGRLVYSQFNYDNTWTGLDNDNKDLPEGGYIWILNVNFGQGRREIYKGTLTILPYGK